jgi:hypothetical protein
LQNHFKFCAKFNPKVWFFSFFNKNEKEQKLKSEIEKTISILLLNNIVAVSMDNIGSAIVHDFLLKPFFFTILFIKPRNLLAHLPLSSSLLTFFANVNTNSVLLAIFPFTHVLASIRPQETALTFTFVIHEATFISLAIFPSQNALAIHFVLLPVTCICFAIRPVVIAKTTYFILAKFTFIIAAICKSQTAFTFFFAFNVVSLITCTIGPAFNTIAMLFVIDPLAFVVSTICM